MNRTASGGHERVVRLLLDEGAVVAAKASLGRSCKRGVIDMWCHSYTYASMCSSDHATNACLTRASRALKSARVAVNVPVGSA